MVMTYSEIMPNMLPILENNGKWISEQKIDGDRFKVRARKVLGKRTIRLVNRNNNNYTNNFPEVSCGVGIRKEAIEKGVIIDGEIGYFNKETGIFEHSKITARQHSTNNRKIMQLRFKYPAKFYAFDLIEYGDINMVNNPLYPFKRRYELLKDIIIDNNVTELLPIRYDLIEHFKEECKAGREGIVVKNLDNIYIDGRTDTIMKCKNWHYSDIEFTGFEENNAGITITNKQGDRVLVAGKKAELVKATIVQLGYSFERIRHLQTRTENNRLREPTHKIHIGKNVC